MATLGNARRRSSGLLRDFQEFALHGSVVDLAVGVIIGAAFGKIVSSFTDDIITPLILNPLLKAAQVDSLASLSAGGIKYGLFISAILNFIIIAFALFLMVRAFAKFKRKEEAAAAAEPDLAVLSQERLTDALDRLNNTLESQQR
jgi:large conductance mechanosensitive channel